MFTGGTIWLLTHRQRRGTSIFVAGVPFDTKPILGLFDPWPGSERLRMAHLRGAGSPSLVLSGHLQGGGSTLQET